MGKSLHNKRMKTKAIDPKSYENKAVTANSKQKTVKDTGLGAENPL
jgi:hypothetical protein